MTAPADTAASKVTEVKKVSLLTLTALVVGSVIGAGVFKLPARFGAEAGVLGAVTAWGISGAGWLMLTFVFQNLAIVKPDLDAGIFSYAREGFGDYIGFNSAWGFWVGNSVVMTFFWVAIMETVGNALPAFRGGNTVFAFAISTAGVWAFAYLVARGVSGAAILNKIATIAKVIPIIVFIVVVAVAAFTVHRGQFGLNLWGNAQPSVPALFSQVKGVMLITTFVFGGVEGAVVYSRYAQRREHVGLATVAGFLGVLCLYALVTMVSYGVLPHHRLATMRQPSMATVMEYIVGQWGYVFISVGLVVSVLGVYLAKTLVQAEILFVPAVDRDLPRFLARQNRAGTPITALIMTSAVVQLFLVVTLFSENALDFLIDLAASVRLFPYLLTAAYGLKIAVTRDGYRKDAPVARHLATGALATVFTVWLLYAAGVKFMLFAGIIYALGIPLYLMARRENRQRTFRPYEAVLCGLLLLAGLTGATGLATGLLTI